ncbi:phenoloxidase-activating factor 2-like isoform X2 [Adelges cooleyi]|uniref:phenoloxidase-activating factor 2-like isoform X2 n=1 Tax=Adelges cooleyi TaxID=133065 RepID=UPI0021803B45|nr:phenoloxidase-activating factor 2-like isoform X2 [Adelges cooleyi]
MHPVRSQPTSPPLFILLVSVSTVLQTTITLAQTPSVIDEAILEVFPAPPDETSSVSPNSGIDNGQPEQGACTCVPYYLCTSNQSINTDGTGLIDIRFVPDPIRIKDGPCSNYLEVCCNNPISPSETTTQSPTSYKETYAGCGHWNSGGVGFRITGHSNNEAQFGEFPWMVAILKEDHINQGKAYVCGGSLIHPSVVLTAYHCLHDHIKDQAKLVIRAGEWDSQTENELFPHQDGRVLKIVQHEKYYGGALYNDVALIFLKDPFMLKENVGTICLPSQDFYFQTERCFASGWGKDVFGKVGSYQVILKKVELPIVPRVPCLDALKRTRLGPNFKLHESFLCAGGESGKDTCKGDGGSPLMCPMPEKTEQYHQAGIVAWGIGCGEDKTPGVYVNVALFRHWIDRQMKKHNYDTRYYDSNYKGTYN